MLEQLYLNEAFWGSLYLSIVGGALGVAYYVAKEVWALAMRAFLVSATLSNQDDAFSWVVAWMAAQPTFNSRRMKLRVKRAAKEGLSQLFGGVADRSEAKLEFQPDSGSHFFWYKRRPMWMSRTEKPSVSTGWDNTPTTPETITITSIGRSGDILVDLVKEAMQRALSADQDKTPIYVLNRWGGGWVKAVSKEPRKLDSVILDAELQKTILDDLENFFKPETEAFYRSRGVPWRRGYLFHGPPGCGKTSFVCALAAHAEMPVCLLTLSGNNIDDQTLNSRLRETPNKSIILLEDVDAIFVKRDAGQQASGVSFSGLLNAIDGVASQENRVVICTTNHIEQLDPALIRPGRLDRHFKFDFASPTQLRGMFLRFFPGEHDAADEFVKLLAGAQLPMAALQGYLMKRRSDASQALRDWKSLLKSQRELEVSALEIGVWLRRLGCEEHTDRFRRGHILSVADLADVSDEQLKKLGVRVLGQRKRILAMIQGRSDVVAQFAWATSAQAEAIFLRAYSNDGGAGESKDGEAAAGTFGSEGGVSELAIEFGERVLPGTVSVAQVTKHMAKHPGDPEGALRSMEDLTAGPDARTAQRELLIRTAKGLLAQDDVEETAEEEMGVRVWLDRLGLLPCADPIEAHAIHTVKQLRAVNTRGWFDELGITSSTAAQTIKDKLDHVLEAEELFAELTSETAGAVAEAVCVSVFPTATRDQVEEFIRKTREVLSADVRPITRGQLVSHCEYHRRYDSFGYRRDDPTGSRATLALPDLAAEPRIEYDGGIGEITTLSKLLKLLGISYIYKHFEKEKLYMIDWLRQPGGGFPDEGTLEQTVNALAPFKFERKLLIAALKREPFAVERVRLITTEQRAGEVFKDSYPRATAADVARFTAGVPLGKFSVGQLIRHCERHRWAGGDAEDCNGGAATAALPRFVSGDLVDLGPNATKDAGIEVDADSGRAAGGAGGTADGSDG